MCVLAGCDAGAWLPRRNAGPAGVLSATSRQEPALSGQGRWLASVVERGGRATLLLQEQPSGRVVQLRHFQNHQPHSSPSLSWNGRYVAALVQQGNQRLPLIEDRATGALHRLPLPADRTAVRLSLAPEGRRLAVQVAQGGQWRVQLFDLSNLLEPDLPGGIALQGGGLDTPR
ncbi:Tol biopolymer transporter periplasmic protein [Cyanobium sp. Alchichica 3B3-8F6]|jgi:Tol biopolymer transport system component|uniref:Tol biopolymer transporter periplasmic protein n=1 Tax=Synechococcales TaxID=1890424 RepID=UPI000B99B17B|nr:MULTISPECIES: Tol biopolymer transporter periplasmic protein [Synechococcales]MCP9882928.1 Tol biopolymer transporter periplasmic protein [Cyanobium sp. Alchichica 3B3-8F6]MCP9942970.1 Tol biopolymer transporter periplasmic protein [Cyanobium sp. ATX 6E8]